MKFHTLAGTTRSMQLHVLITPESVSEPPASTVQTAPTGDQDIAHVRTDRGCKKSGSNRTDGGSSTQLLERKEWLRQDNAAVRVESLGLEMEDPDDFPSEPYTRDGYDSDGYQIDDGSFFVEVQCGPDEVPGVVHVARCGADDRDEGPRKGLYRCHDQTGSDRDEWYPVMVWPRLLLDIHGSGLIDSCIVRAAPAWPLSSRSGARRLHVGNSFHSFSLYEG